MSKERGNNPVYQIRLGCHIEKHQQYWFDDLLVKNLDNGECLISGLIPDQAALFGILLKIRDLGLPLISVNRMEKVERSPRKKQK